MQARRLGLTPEVSEDVVQEALLRLHVYMQSREVLSEIDFLRRTVHNLVVDQFRRTRSNRPQISLDELGAELISMSPGPDRIVAAQDALSEVERAVAAEIATGLQIVIAREAGATRAEIARDMHVSPITIRRRLARTRVLLSTLKDWDRM